MSQSQTIATISREGEMSSVPATTPESNEKRSSMRSCKPWNMWLKLTNSFHRLSERFFSNHGHFVSRHCWKVIAITLIWVASVAWGFAFMKTETRTEKLYIPQNSRSLRDMKVVEEHFLVRQRLAELIITPRVNNSILYDNVFQSALRLHQRIVTGTDFASVCLKHDRVPPTTNGSLSECQILSPFELFSYDEREVVNILPKLNVFYQNTTLLMSNQLPARVNFPSFFGNMAVDASGEITRAGALRLFYSIIFPLSKRDTDRVNHWEDAFIRTVQESEGALSREGLNVDYFTIKSIDDSVKSSSGADSKFILLAFALMCLVAVLSFLKPWKRFLSHCLLAQCGLIAVVFGIGSSFGLLMLAGVPFVSIVGVLPFVILGVAIDDMFIMVDFLDRTDVRMGTSERIAEALKKCGGSITMTTLTDLVAFLAGMTTEFPAVRYFCAYAAAGLFTSYIMIITFFVACMKLDIDRAKAGRLDLLFCIKRKKKTKATEILHPLVQRTIANKVMHSIGQILMTKVGKISVIMAAVGLVASGIISATNISEHFDLKMLGQDGSYFKRFLDVRDLHFDEPYVVTVMVPREVDLSTLANQEEIIKIDRLAMANQYYKPRSDNWLRDFRLWAFFEDKETTGSDFMENLKLFLQSPNGRQHNHNIVMDTTRTTIEASRVVIYLKDYLTSSESKTAMETLREDMDTKVHVKTYPVTMYFMYYEQYVRILPETIRNLALCAITILVMTSPYVIHPGILFTLFLSFSCLIVELLGLMAIWNVSLNSISMIVIIMAIGFSVDYSAHIAHAYVVSSADTPENRMIDALSTVGASVFMGGFSTFIGIVSLAFTSSEVFRIFFKMLFGIVFIGLLNGLIILPVLLTVCCRTKIFKSNSEPKVELPIVVVTTCPVKEVDFENGHRKLQRLFTSISQHSGAGAMKFPDELYFCNEHTDVN